MIENATYLGLDLGTSGVKAVLTDGDQNPIARANAPLSVSRPREGWSEQDPAAWITAVRSAVSGLAASHPAQTAAVRAMGLSGHMHGATLIDANDRVLRPCMLWNDVRSFEQAARMDGDAAFRAVSGNIVFPGFTAPKVQWVREQEPGVFAKTAKVLLPKDYLRLWLTGEYVSEPSDAAGTGWLDTAARTWNGELLDACGLSPARMPDLVEGTQASGVLRPELAAAWGMRGGMRGAVTVAGGGGDNAAAACGLGVIRNGQAFVSLGTSGVLFAANDSYRPKPETAVHTFCHALPETWHQMGVILSAGDALNWLASVTRVPGRSLTGGLGTSLKAPTGLGFLPYLSGERTPHNDANIRGAFMGIAHNHDQTAMTQAVLEGVCFALKDSMNALAETGTGITRLLATGGGAGSDYWLKALATVLGIPVDVPAAGDFGAAFGAARLAMAAVNKTDPDRIFTKPAVRQTFTPDLALVPAFDAAYHRFRAHYQALKNLG